ncbi:MAG: DUF4384 domain-containing protein [bacterium]
MTQKQIPISFSNEYKAGNQSHPIADLFGTKEMLQIVIKKLSSQSLIFSLAFIVILVIAYKLCGNQGLPIIAAILFVFLVATVAYLFFEQKSKVEHEDPSTISQLLGEKLNAIAKPTGDFSVQVWTTLAAETTVESRDINIIPSAKQAKYRIGDKINVCFRSTKDCYLTLLNIGTSGKLTILFPNGLYRNNLISANQSYEIPGKEYGFEYGVLGPPGIEKLKAIATLEKVELLASQFSSDGSLFRIETPAAAARDITVIKKNVEAIPTDKWTEATCEFRVNQ